MTLQALKIYCLHDKRNDQHRYVFSTCDDDAIQAIIKSLGWPDSSFNPNDSQVDVEGRFRPSVIGQLGPHKDGHWHCIGHLDFRVNRGINHNLPIFNMPVQRNMVFVG